MSNHEDVQAPPQPQQPGHGPDAAKPPAPQAGTPKPWYRRTWVIAVGALLLGTAIGSAGAGEADPTTSTQYQELEKQLDAAEAERDAAADELDAAEADLETIAGDLPAREKAVTEGEEALAAEQSALEKRRKELTKTEKSLARRERAVGIAEKEVARNTIPGDGVFQVGTDMKPGLYKSAGMTNCYYAVNADANGNNIKSNNITDGPATVSVSAGEWFESRGCADWVLQR